MEWTTATPPIFSLCCLLVSALLYFQKPVCHSSYPNPTKNNSSFTHHLPSPSPNSHVVTKQHSNSSQDVASPLRQRHAHNKRQRGKQDPPYPSFLHSTGKLSKGSQTRTNAEITAHAGACMGGEPLSLPDPSNRLLALPMHVSNAPRTANTDSNVHVNHTGGFEIGVTEAFLISSFNATTGTRKCTGGDYIEVFMFCATSRLHVRVNDLYNGLYLVYFHALRPCNYTLKVNYLFDTPPDRWNWFIPVLEFKNFMVSTDHWEVSSLLVTEGKTTTAKLKQARSRLPLCSALIRDRVPYWGNWEYLPTDQGSEETEWFVGVPPDWSTKESPGWVYVPFTCRFQYWDWQAAWKAVDNKWLFFLGDSTVSATRKSLMLFLWSERIRRSPEMKELNRVYAATMQGRVFDAVICDDGALKIISGKKRTWAWRERLNNTKAHCMRMTFCWAAYKNPMHKFVHTGARTLMVEEWRNRIASWKAPKPGRGDVYPSVWFWSSSLHDARQFVDGIRDGKYQNTRIKICELYRADVQNGLDWLHAFAKGWNNQSQVVWLQTEHKMQPKRHYLDGALQQSLLEDASANVVAKMKKYHTSKRVIFLDNYDLSYPFAGEEETVHEQIPGFSWPVSKPHTWSDGHHYCCEKVDLLVAGAVIQPLVATVEAA
eukprot:TRINITY_DN67408_c1_g1_i8.p1 TRINITY_DN67408_c1_g1~~TRINITY_DN67408_c1_g1_i8.p1  ORF type:complete len:655 (-),score=23.08 TRINITY_DN67408_c1_g1_i8:335-2299(-)